MFRFRARIVGKRAEYNAHPSISIVTSKGYLQCFVAPGEEKTPTVLPRLFGARE